MVDLDKILCRLREVIAGTNVEVNSINFDGGKYIIHVTSAWDGISINKDKINKILKDYNLEFYKVTYYTDYGHSGYDRDIEHAYIQCNIIEPNDSNSEGFDEFKEL